MPARPNQVAAAVAGLMLFPCANLAAQRPQIRDGFWISFGFGAGTVTWECDGCTRQDHGGPTGFLRMGGTTSNKILLGGEINGWALDIGAAEITSGYTAFTVYWYPKATGGFYFKGGLGAAIYARQTNTTEATSSGAAIVTGVGYDIRVARKFSLSPMLTLWTSTQADLKDDATTLNSGFRHGGATLQLGFTFH
jgi:hypothetical protein